METTIILERTVNLSPFHTQMHVEGPLSICIQLPLLMNGWISAAGGQDIPGVVLPSVRESSVWSRMLLLPAAVVWIAPSSSPVLSLAGFQSATFPNSHSEHVMPNRKPASLGTELEDFLPSFRNECIFPPHTWECSLCLYVGWLSTVCCTESHHLDLFRVTIIPKGYLFYQSCSRLTCNICALYR